MRTEELPGGIAARVIGAGPPLWLLHSLLADAGSCLPLAQTLASDYRVVVPELPGFGGSRPAGPALAGIADRLADAMGRETAPVALFGNGYGSFVALTLALRHPRMVRALLLAGTGAAFSEPGRAAFRGMAQAVRVHGLAAIADTAMQRLFSAHFQAAHPALLAERRAAFLATDPAVFIGGCEALAALDLRDAVPALTAPTLIMVGTEDAATPPPMARELATRLPGATLVELPGFAHVPQLQATAQVAALLCGFLEGG